MKNVELFDARERLGALKLKLDVCMRRWRDILGMAVHRGARGILQAQE